MARLILYRELTLRRAMRSGHVRTQQATWPRHLGTAAIMLEIGIRKRLRSRIVVTDLLTPELEDRIAKAVQNALRNETRLWF